MEGKFLKVGMIYLLLLIGFLGVGSVRADTKTQTTQAQAGFLAGSGPVFPLDPQNPDVSQPIAPNNPDATPWDSQTGTATVDQAGLSLDFASSLSFGTHVVQGNTAIYFSCPQSYDNNTQYTANFVQVSDQRGSLAGWALSVTQVSQFHLNGVVADEVSANGGDYLTGAQMTFTSGRLNTTNDLTNPNYATIVPGYNNIGSVNTGEISLIPMQQTLLISARASQGMGTWLLSFGQPTDYASDNSKSPISLVVPAGVAIPGQVYTSTLQWTLSDAP
jgi:hypothetical protein